MEQKTPKSERKTFTCENRETVLKPGEFVHLVIEQTWREQIGLVYDAEVEGGCSIRGLV